MGEKKAALFLVIVVLIIAAFFIFAVNMFYPGLLTDLFTGASDTVDTGLESIDKTADPSQAQWG